jgi:hypothetical protein
MKKEKLIVFILIGLSRIKKRQKKSPYIIKMQELFFQ